MADFYIKNGTSIDTRPVIEGALKDPQGNIIDLTDATSVQLVMALIDDSASYSRSATIETPRTGGKVYYQWVTTTDNAIVPGLYKGEWKISWNDGSSQRIPNRGYFYVEVEKGLS